MSGHHDIHHVTEKKPVAFTVPLILAIVTVIIVLLFLSLCDPSHAHHNAGAHEHGATTGSHGDHGTKDNAATHGDSHDQGPEGGQETHHQ